MLARAIAKEGFEKISKGANPIEFRKGIYFFHLYYLCVLFLKLSCDLKKPWEETFLIIVIWNFISQHCKSKFYQYLLLNSKHNFDSVNVNGCNLLNLALLHESILVIHLLLLPM